MALRRRPSPPAPDAVVLPVELAEPLAAEWVDLADHDGTEGSWSMLAARAFRRHRDAFAVWLAEHPGATAGPLPAPRFTNERNTR